MLAFPTSYFSESGLFNGLLPIQIKKILSQARPRTGLKRRAVLLTIRRAPPRGADSISPLIHLIARISAYGKKNARFLPSPCDLFGLASARPVRDPGRFGGFNAPYKQKTAADGAAFEPFYRGNRLRRIRRGYLVAASGTDVPLRRGRRGWAPDGRLGNAIGQARSSQSGEGGRAALLVGGAQALAGGKLGPSCILGGRGSGRRRRGTTPAQARAAPCARHG
jgi:hypothetical protein